MTLHRRKPMRLRGYDYSQPGEYFVTICTRDRLCMLGDVVDGVMTLSDAGMAVERCWKEIPAHFENTRVDVYRVMPNHVHGIIEIRNPVGVEYIQPLRGRHGDGRRPKQHRYQHVIPKSLGSIIRSFKAAVAREVRRNTNRSNIAVWQRDFYDHIIRSDVDHYFIQQYIELNPLLWHLDSDNPEVRTIPIDELKRTLKERHGLNEHAIAYLVDCEMNYRARRVIESRDQPVGVKSSDEPVGA